MWRCTPQMLGRAGLRQPHAGTSRRVMFHTLILRAAAYLPVPSASRFRTMAEIRDKLDLTRGAAAYHVEVLVRADCCTMCERFVAAL